MKRVLILAYYFPPIAASGSMRPLGFCQHLEAQGYLPHIVSTDPDDAHPPVSTDDSLVTRIPANVRVDRLAHINRLKQLLEWRDRLRNYLGRRSPQAANPVTPETVGAASVGGGDSGDSGESEDKPEGRLRRIKDAVLNRLFLFPDHQKPWINAVVKHVKALPESERPDVVFATANPWSALIAGAKVAKQLDIPFIADFRDPWTRNPKPAVSEALHRLALKAERGVMEQADIVVANTAALKQQFIEDYPGCGDKIVNITNAYSDHLLELFQGMPACEFPNAVEISHFGSVYELRKPDRLLQTLHELVEQALLTEGRLKIRFIGHWGVEDAECNRLAAELEARGFISREPALSHGDYLAAMKRSKYLLILQQAFPLQIPGKLYEYIATGRPLIVVGGEGATADLINSAQLGVTCANEKATLSQLLLGLVSGEVATPVPTAEQIAGFSYSAVTRQLAQVFDQVTVD